MQKLLPIVALVVATGCWSRSRTPGRVGGGVTVGLGTLVLVDGLTSKCDQNIEDLNDGVGCAITQDIGPTVGGALIVAGLLVLLANELRDVDEKPAVERAPAPPKSIGVVPEPETADSTLRQLTLQASLAARNGHCSTVSVIAARIEQIDPSYRRDGFQRDDKILACLR